MWRLLLLPAIHRFLAVKNEAIGCVGASGPCPSFHHLSCDYHAHLTVSTGSAAYICHSNICILALPLPHGPHFKRCEQVSACFRPLYCALLSFSSLSFRSRSHTPQHYVLAVLMQHRPPSHAISPSGSLVFGFGTASNQHLT